MASDFFESGGSTIPVAASEQALSALTPQDLMAIPRKVRPDWMVTRYPVSMAEFEHLNSEAHKPDRSPHDAHADTAFADVTADADAAITIDVPEDQVLAEAPQPAAATTTASFIGIPATGWRPSDTSIAVGLSNVLLGVNTDLAGYSKAGALQFRWNNMITLFRNVLPPGASIFDPALFYDHYAHRYVVVVAARRQSPAGSWILIGVSQTENPGGTYWIWSLDATVDGSTPTGNWADYPKVGFDTQAVYIATNQFQVGGAGNFQYAKFRILKQERALQWSIAALVRFLEPKKRRWLWRLHSAAGASLSRNWGQPASILCQRVLPFWQPTDALDVGQPDCVLERRQPYSDAPACRVPRL